MAKELFDQFRHTTNFPEKWELMELNELIYDLRGGSPLEPEDFLEKGFPVLHKGAIKPFGEIEIDPKKKAFTHDDFVKKYSKSVINREYTVVTLRDLIPSGPSIGLISTLYSSPYPEYILAQGAYAFLVNKKLVIPEYLVWLSNTYDYRKFVRTIAVGSTQIHVRTPVFTSIPIPLPPLEEQKRIVAILGKCDRLRRTRRYTLQLSDTFLQSVFLELFGVLETNSKNWKIKNLDEVSDIASGVTKGQKFNGKKTIEVPYMRVANVQDGYLDLTEIKTIQALASEVEQLKLEKGDVLMTEGGDFDKLGRGAIWHGQIENCIHQNHIFRVRANRSLILPEFFAKLLLTQYSKLYFLKCSKQTTNLATINMTQLKGLPVPLPPLPLQEKFAQIVQKFERFRTQQREADRQAEHLFQTLLHRAFRGELTSSDFDDEAVSALSKEIGVKQAKAKPTGEVAEYLHTKVSQQETEAVQLTLPGLE